MKPVARRLAFVLMLVAVVGLSLAGVAFYAATHGEARLSVAQGMGRNPSLPAPDTSLLPVINVVTAKGWGAHERPTSGDGMQVELFASNLDHPRWIHVLPNGDVLVAETNAPTPRTARGFGVSSLRADRGDRHHRKAAAIVRDQTPAPATKRTT